MPVKDNEVKFNFGGDGFSAGNAQLVELDSFLDENPDDVVKIEKKKEKIEGKKKAEEGEETEEEKKEKARQKALAEKAPLGADDIFGNVEEGSEEEEDPEEGNEEGDELPEVLKKKTPTVVTKKAQGDEGQDDKDPEESPFTSLTKDLLALGVFTPTEDEEGNEVAPDVKNAEDFLKTFQSEVKKQTGTSIQKFLEQYGPEYGEMFEAVFINGVPPYEYISRQAKIETVADYDISTEEAQEKVVRQWLRSEGRTPERIEAIIQKHKNYADLEDEAKEAKSLLIAKEQKDLQNLAQQKQQQMQRRQQEKIAYVNTVQRVLAEKLKNKDFDGIPVDKRFAEQTYAYLTKDAYETKDKQLLTEFDKDLLDLNRPENNAKKVKVAMLLQLLNSDPTLSKLGKKAISKESSRLFNEVERKFGKTSKSPAKEAEDNSNW